MTTSAKPKVLVEHKGPITTVILNRPEARNAVDNETAEMLADAFRAFDADAEQKVAVLWGSGGAFCAGADLKAVATGERIKRYNLDGDGPMGPSRLKVSKPVIAAVAGHAVAGGLELAIWCDLRVAEEDAVFGVYCRRWGVPLIDGGTYRLPQIVGLGRALDLILTGREISSDEAERMGFLTRVVDDGQALTAAVEMAGEIASFPWLGVVNDRRSVYAGLGLGVDEALTIEDELGRQTIFADGFREGVGRFDDHQATRDR